MGPVTSEQARGLPVNYRSDQFSFGLILYELVSGNRAFQKETTAHTLAAIISEEPPPIEVKLPAPLRWAIDRCLAKEPAERYESTRDLYYDLRALRDHLADADASVAAAGGAAWAVPAGSRILPWIAAGIAVILAALGWIRALRPVTIAPADVTFSIPPPPGKTLPLVGGLSIDRISPDGTMVLFRVDERFYLRRMNSLESEILPAWNYGGDPFGAPDSRSIVLQVLGSGLMKLSIPNGAPEPLADTANGGRGGSWGERGTVLFAGGANSLFSVPATGGAEERVEVPGLKAGAYYNPEFLPGGEDFLFEFVPSGLDSAQVFLATLRDGKAVNPKLLMGNETSAAFTPAGGGRILFVRNDNVYSQKLDLNARALSGSAELVQQHVASYAGPRNAYFSVSRNGTLVWRSGTALVSQITVFDRKGNRTGLAGVPAPVSTIRLSPDESHLIAEGESGVWIMEASGPGRVGLKRETFESGFLWSPDSTQLVFARGNKPAERPVSGSGPLQEFAENPGLNNLFGISPDGRQLLIGDRAGLSLFPLDGKRMFRRVVTRKVHDAALSPDGKWLLYHPIDETGLYALPISGDRLPGLIADNAFRPVWRADGREIVYYDSRGASDPSVRIASVRVERSGELLRFGAPQTLFAVTHPGGIFSGDRPLAVNHDGSRIYFLQSSEQPDSGVIQVHIGAIR